MHRLVSYSHHFLSAFTHSLPHCLPHSLTHLLTRRVSPPPISSRASSSLSPERLQEEDLTPPDYRGGLDRYGRPLRTKEEAALWKATNKNKADGAMRVCD